MSSAIGSLARAKHLVLNIHYENNMTSTLIQKNRLCAFSHSACLYVSLLCPSLPAETVGGFVGGAGAGWQGV